jgi:protein-disulfide isomerase
MKKILIIFLVIAGICSVYEFTRKKNNYSFSDTGIVYGNPDAENKLVIFTSFQCEKCEQFSKSISATVKDMIKSGEYCIVIKPVNKTFYQIDNCMNLKYEELEGYYNKPVEVKKITNENAEILKTIENEMDDNDIDVIPMYFYNGKKYGGTSDVEFKEVVSGK